MHTLHEIKKIYMYHIHVCTVHTVRVHVHLHVVCIYTCEASCMSCMYACGVCMWYTHDIYMVHITNVHT
jgi:hypothetical protein